VGGEIKSLRVAPSLATPTSPSSALKRGRGGRIFGGARLGVHRPRHAKFFVARMVATCEWSQAHAAPKIAAPLPRFSAAAAMACAGTDARDEDS